MSNSTANLPGPKKSHGREAPELRQPYAGLTLNHALDVEIKDNIVKTESPDDYSYVMDSGMTLGSGSGNNKNCKVAAAGGTGFGRIDSGYGSAVTSATWAECTAVMDI